MHQDLGQLVALKLNYERKFRGPDHLSITTTDFINPKKVTRSLKILSFYDIDPDHGDGSLRDVRV
jgi:hypothetical protein